LPESIFATVVKRATYSSMGALIGRVIMAVTGIILARAVGPAMFGVYAAIWALMELSSAFTEIGVITGLKREGARSPEMMSGLLGNAIGVKFVIGALFYAAALACLPLVTKSPLAPALFVPLVLASFSTLCSEPFLAVLQIRGEQRIASAWTVSRGLAFLVGTGIAAYLGCSVVVLAWLQGLTYAVAGVLITCVAVRRVSVKLNLSYLRKQMKGAFVFGVSEILYSAYLRIPLLCLSHFGTEEDVGYFAVALRFVTICVLAGAAANNEAFLPALFGLHKSNRGEFRRVCALMQRLLLAGGIAASAALFACSEFLVIVLQGEEYRDAVRVLRTLCWSVALSYGSIAADAALTAGDRMRAKIVIQTCVTGGLLLLALVLTGKLGVMGSTYVTLWGCCATLALMVPYAYVRNMFPFAGLAGLVLPSVLTVAAAVVTVEVVSDQFLLGPLCFFGAAGLCWYPFLRKGITRGFAS